MASTSGEKLNTLTLKSKIELINDNERLHLNVKKLCKKFNCGKSQVYNILKNKGKIKEEWLSGQRHGGSKRKLKKTGNETINRIVHEWYLNARSRNIPVSGPILQENAIIIAERLKNYTFKASNGWLESFRVRHEITFKQICGEAKDVDLTIVEDWKQKLAELTKNYEPKNIANADETGLFFRAIPSKTLSFKKDKCIDGKQSKERLTVLLCGFADGTMEKPLVIGKNMKPLCFKNLNVCELPVIWRSNKKAWMTSGLMDEWLKSLNKKMQIQNRHILLFLDNATCHPHLDLSNIKLCFLPANTTSLSQPMDQGVIHNFKVHYRKQVLQSICANMGTCNSATELSNKISVLDAIHWISHAQRNVTTNCIKNCFQKAGFIFKNIKTENEDPISPQQIIDIEDLMKDIKEIHVTPLDYICMDDELLVNDPTMDELLANVKQETEIENRLKDDNQYEETPGVVSSIDGTEKISCFFDAFKKVTALEQYAKQIECTLMLESLVQLRTVMEQKAFEDNEKISCFFDAFKKVTALERYAEQIECIPMLESLMQLRTVMEQKAVEENSIKTNSY